MKNITRNYASLICLAFVFCCACNPLPKAGSQLWFYSYASGKINKDSMLTPVNFMYLGKDGNYTRDFGVFDYGHWSKNDHQLLLKNVNNAVTTLPIKSESEKNMQLLLGEMLVNFEAQHESLSPGGNNPFELKNNFWRVHAKVKETEQQIKSRLQNHFQFWETYFLWALDNDFSTVDVRSTPTPIKIYGNGFGLKPYKELPNEWRAVFYDSTDCQQANRIIKDIFDNHTIAWSHSNSKYKMFIAAFQQMEAFVK